MDPTQQKRKERDAHRKQIGHRGEEIAKEKLREIGFEVLESNFRSGHNEIDIICRDVADIRFVEVKSRQEPLEGRASDAVNIVKQRRMVQAARGFLSGESCRRLPFRVNDIHFDVITVVWDRTGEKITVEYIPDAFIPIYA